MRRLAIALLAIAVLLLIADRVALVVAERSSAAKLAQYGQFEAKPSVHIGGFPFLTQAIGGKYNDVEITSDAVTLGPVPRARLDVHLRGASIPLSKLTGGQVTSLPVATVSGRVVIGYADLPRLSNLAGLTFGHSGDRLDLSGQLTVPVLGSVSFSGSGTVTVVAGRLAVHVQTLDVGGVSASGPELSTISAAVGDAISIPTLPYGLKIDSVQVTPSGLVITGGAKGVTLTSS